MTFEYQDAVFNLLDTPGHEDFSEDTYRTLTAADSAVMVIDAAKGIEAQTRKLFEVCRLRDIPIMTFVNKMDREARDPFELLDEISDQLQIETAPMMWPAGMGLNFKGVLDLYDRRIRALRHATSASAMPPDARCCPRAEGQAGRRCRAGARGPAALRSGHLSRRPSVAGLFRLGAEEFRRGGTAGRAGRACAAARARRPPMGRDVEPGDKEVTGFVFKVQANMDPNHRDRVAFLRLASGEFRRNMKLKQSGTGKTIGVHNPILFFASERETVDEAWPGDIIGIPNHGVLRVGDTLSESGDVVFTGIPNFAPEILRRVRLADPMKQKHLARALESLAEEGVTQVFKPMIGAQWIVGVVGALQLDVLKIAAGGGIWPGRRSGSRRLTTAPAGCRAREAEIEKFAAANRGGMATDRDGAPVFLAKSAWELGYVAEKFPECEIAEDAGAARSPRRKLKACARLAVHASRAIRAGFAGGHCRSVQHAHRHERGRGPAGPAAPGGKGGAVQAERLGRPPPGHGRFRRPESAPAILADAQRSASSAATTSPPWRAVSTRPVSRIRAAARGRASPDRHKAARAGARGCRHPLRAPPGPAALRRRRAFQRDIGRPVGQQLRHFLGQRGAQGRALVGQFQQMARALGCGHASPLRTCSPHSLTFRL